MESIIVYGNGAVARTAYYFLAADSPYRVEAFTVDREVIGEPQLLGVPVIAFDEVERHFAPRTYQMLVAVGFSDVNRLRAERYRQAKEKGYSFINCVSSRATVCPDLAIGENCILGANVVIQPQVRIGHNTFIRDNSFIGHDAVIGEHCYIGAGAVVLGRSSIGSYSLIGAHATIRDGVQVGAACIIGAGVALLQDARDKEVYMSKGAQKLPLTSDQL